MNYHISPLVKRVAVITGFALGAFAVTAAADWSAPANPPPTCPTGSAGCDAPLNVGGTAQTKAGGLTVSGAFTTSNLTTLGNGFAGAISVLIPNGTVGIGTANPDTTTKLDVETGAIKAGGGLIIQTCASAACPTAATAKTGQMWLVTP